MQTLLLVPLLCGLFSAAWCHIATGGFNSVPVPHSHVSNPRNNQPFAQGRNVQNPQTSIEWQRRFRGAPSGMTIHQVSSWANTAVQTHQACGISATIQQGVATNSLPHTVCECLGSPSCDGGTEDRSRTARRQCQGRRGRSGSRCCCMATQSANAFPGSPGFNSIPQIRPRVNLNNQVCGESLTRQRFSFNALPSTICECSRRRSCSGMTEDRSSSARRQCRRTGDSARCCCRGTHNSNAFPVGLPGTQPLIPRINNAGNQVCGLNHRPHTVCECRRSSSCHGGTEDRSRNARQQCRARGDSNRCCCQSVPSQNTNVFPGASGFPQVTGINPGVQTGFIPGAQTGFIPGAQTGFIPGAQTGFIPGAQTGFIPGVQGGVVGTPGVFRTWPNGVQQVGNGVSGFAQVVPGQSGGVHVAPGFQGGMHVVPGAPGVMQVVPGTQQGIPVATSFNGGNRVAPGVPAGSVLYPRRFLFKK